MDKLGSVRAISSAETLAAMLVATPLAKSFGSKSSGKGQIDRGGGKIVDWSFKGQLMGFEWKYIGTCVDQVTGETATAVKQSRDGSIEHSMRDLFQKLAAKGAL